MDRQVLRSNWQKIWQKAGIRSWSLRLLRTCIRTPQLKMMCALKRFLPFIYRYFTRPCYVTPFPSLYIKKLFHTFQPDVVHIQDHYFLCSAAVNEARRREIPIIGTNHFLPENILPFLKELSASPASLHNPFMENDVIRLQQTGCGNHPVQDSRADITRAKDSIPVHAISNGVDTCRFKPDPEVDRVGVRRKYGLAADKISLPLRGTTRWRKTIGHIIGSHLLIPA